MFGKLRRREGLHSAHRFRKRESFSVIGGLLDLIGTRGQSRVITRTLFPAFTNSIESKVARKTGYIIFKNVFHL